MMCNFRCIKHSLIFCNALYLVTGAFLLYMGASGKLFTPAMDILPPEKGIIVCEILTIIMAIFGLYATYKQHQVILFFYMFILFFLFVIQFTFSYQLLSRSEDDYRVSALKIWEQTNATNQMHFMKEHQCCSFESPSPRDPPCDLPCCVETCNCLTCGNELTTILMDWHELFGRWSCVSSFIDIIGVFLTKRYRNLKDPRAHPSAFL